MPAFLGAVNWLWLAIGIAVGLFVVPRVMARFSK